MKCPNCNSDLIVVEKDGLKLNFCSKCKGIWFDAWEWDDLAEIINIDKENFNDLEKNGQVVTDITEKYRQCPVCNRRMEKTEAFGIIIDRCIADGGIWFDGKELSKVLNVIAEKSGMNKDSLNMYINQICS